MGRKFRKLEREVEASERKAHPNYSAAHIKYIADAVAGQTARRKRMAVA